MEYFIRSTNHRRLRRWGKILVSTRRKRLLPGRSTSGSGIPKQKWSWQEWPSINIFIPLIFIPDQAFQNHGHILQTHNRWWAPDNVYAKQNGGEYDFIIEPDGVEIHGPITIEGPNGRPIEILDGYSYKKGPFAIPNDDKFWIDFFKDVKTWGVNSYLQDRYNRTVRLEPSKPWLSYWSGFLAVNFGPVWWSGFLVRKP